MAQVSIQFQGSDTQLPRFQLGSSSLANTYDTFFDCEVAFFLKVK